MGMWGVLVWLGGGFFEDVVVFAATMAGGSSCSITRCDVVSYTFLRKVI